jgi:hypothetical protein
LTPAEREQALDVTLPRIRVRDRETPTSRIGLVSAGRPADVLPLIGWGGLAGRGESLLPLTAVLRSWEDRFGARLIDVGYAGLRLLAERPPRTDPAPFRVSADVVTTGVLATGAQRRQPAAGAGQQCRRPGAALDLNADGH